LESIACFTGQLLDPTQPTPSVEKTQALLKLFETLTWQLQDDEEEVREEAARIVSLGIRLPYGVSSEKALTLVYDQQLKMFAGQNANESQVQLLIESLVSSFMGVGKPGMFFLYSFFSFFFFALFVAKLELTLYICPPSPPPYSSYCCRVITAKQDVV